MQILILNFFFKINERDVIENNNIIKLAISILPYLTVNDQHESINKDHFALSISAANEEVSKPPISSACSSFISSIADLMFSVKQRSKPSFFLGAETVCNCTEEKFDFVNRLFQPSFIAEFAVCSRNLGPFKTILAVNRNFSCLLGGHNDADSTDDDDFFAFCGIKKMEENALVFEDILNKLRSCVYAKDEFEETTDPSASCSTPPSDADIIIKCVLCNFFENEIDVKTKNEASGEIGVHCFCMFICLLNGQLVLIIK